MTYLDPYTPWIIQQFQQLLLLPTIVYFAIALTVFVIGLGVYLTSTDFSLEDVLSLLPSTIVSVRKSINKRRVSAIVFVILGLAGIFTFADQLQVEGSRPSGGGPSVYSCQDLPSVLCGGIGNSGACTPTNIGTSSCNLPQNGCDGVLRGYGRCEQGVNTVTVPATALSGSTNINYPTAFTNTPLISDFTLSVPTGLASYFTESSLTLFSGQKTWFNVPQSQWTELFGDTAWENNGNPFIPSGGTGSVALEVGCQNCTGFENFGLEFSTDQLTWHKTLNFTMTSVPSGGSLNSAVSPLFSALPAGGIAIGSWFRVTANNQVGASESLVFTNITVLFNYSSSRIPVATPLNISKTLFQCVVNQVARSSSSINYQCSWKVYVATG